MKLFIQNVNNIHEDVEASREDSNFLSIFNLVHDVVNPTIDTVKVEEDNIDIPEDYDADGCPIVPISFSGMTGRLGNIISTYVNFIALQYKLGYKYHLPLYMNLEPVNLTRPFLSAIFKNVSFPTAHWSNFSRGNFRDAGDTDMILFNNSRTGYEFKHCNKEYIRTENVEPLFSDLYKCEEKLGCQGKRCHECGSECGCGNIWVTVATGANYPSFEFIGDVLQDIIKDHLQFTDDVLTKARNEINKVEEVIKTQNVDILDDHHYVGVHVR